MQTVIEPLTSPRLGRRGMTFHELLAAVTIVGILAMIVVPRLGSEGRTSKSRACQLNRGVIEVQAQLWFRNQGNWPAADLRDIGADAKYFPEGIPECPVDGSAYRFDANTQTVVGHNH